MLLVNTCVFDSCCQTTLLRWTILQSENERLSLTDFYERVSFCTLHKVVCTVAIVTLALNCTICVCCSKSLCKIMVLFVIIMIFIVMNNGNGPPARMGFPGSPDGKLKSHLQWPNLSIEAYRCFPSMSPCRPC